MEDNKQEDFDILFVLRSIKRSFIGVFENLLWLINFSIRKAPVLIVFISLSVLISIGLKQLQTPFYKSEMAISHIRFDNESCKSVVNSINSFINPNTEDQPELAKELSLSAEYAKNIVSVTYSPLNERVAERYMDSVHILLPFKIEVDVYDNFVLDTLQVKLLNYLENNEFVVKRKKIELQIIESTQEKIKKEIAETDSLKRLVNQSIVPRGGGGTGIVLGEPIDPVSVYKRGFELYERNLQFGRKKELNSSFELIFGFVKKPNPSNVSWTVFVFTGIIFGYIIGILWLLRREQNLKSKINE